MMIFHPCSSLPVSEDHTYTYLTDIADLDTIRNGKSSLENLQRKDAEDFNSTGSVVIIEKLFIYCKIF